MPHQLRQSLLLLITALIWGSGFVAQALGVEYIGPFAFTWGRSFVGGLFLLALMPLIDRIKGNSAGSETGLARDFRSPRLWIGGIVCGTILFVSESLQQFGLLYTPVGKAAFITSLYIIFVPIIAIFFGKKTGINIWIAVFIAVFGLYLLCVKDSASLVLQKGDILVFLCAISFSVHILAIDHFINDCEGVRMSCLQFFVGSFWGMLAMVVFEPVSLSDLYKALGCILYAGILSNGVAYTLQIVGQRGINPTLASLIMSLESVFGVLFGWLILGQVLSTRELLGCFVMAIAICIAQLPSSWFRKKSR